MTNSELQSWLNDFDDDLVIVVDVSENVNGGDLCVESLEQSRMDYDKDCLVITIGPDVT